MKRKFADVLPVGADVLSVKRMLPVGYLLTVLISIFNFALSLRKYLGDIYSYSESGEKFLNGEMMVYFKDVRGNCFSVFKLLIICLVAFAVYNFISHYVGAKSVYTMRRLKDPFEFPLRCVFVPLMSILAALATVYLLNLIFCGIYIVFVPEECLRLLWQSDMWRVFV